MGLGTLPGVRTGLKPTFLLKVDPDIKSRRSSPSLATGRHMS
jgi:hypothetical protein